MSRRKKYRCGTCERIQWIAASARDGEWRARAKAEAIRIRKDPIARRALQLRWRRRVIVGVIAVLVGVTVEIMITRMDES